MNEKNNHFDFNVYSDKISYHFCSYQVISSIIFKQKKAEPIRNSLILYISYFNFLQKFSICDSYLPTLQLSINHKAVQ